MVRVAVPEGTVLPEELKPLSNAMVDKVSGVMTTHQCDDFMDEEEVKHHSMLRSPPKVLMGVITRLTAFVMLVNTLLAWARDKAKEIGAEAFSVGIELNPKPKSYGRVHLHVMFSASPIPHMHPWARIEPKMISCYIKQLVFRGKVPHVSTLKSKNGKGCQKLVQHGHYYVQGPKEGQLYCFGEDFRYGDIQPLKEVFVKQFNEFFEAFVVNIRLAFANGFDDESVSFLCSS